MPSHKVAKSVDLPTVNLPTESDVAKYQMIYPMITSMYDEMKTLSAKKQDGVLNNFKIKSVSKLINSARELLVEEPTLTYLEILEEEMLPQNSDVVLILSQYIDALKQYKNKYYVNIGGGTYKWNTKENPQDYIIK